MERSETGVLFLYKKPLYDKGCYFILSRFCYTLHRRIFCVKHRLFLFWKLSRPNEINTVLELKSEKR